MKKRKFSIKKKKSLSKNRRNLILSVVILVIITATTLAVVDTIQHMSTSKAYTSTSDINGPVWVTGYQNNSFSKNIKSSDTTISLALSSDKLIGLMKEYTSADPGFVKTGYVGDYFVGIEIGDDAPPINRYPYQKPAIPRILIYKDYVGLYANGKLIQTLTPIEPTGLAASCIKDFKETEAKAIGVSYLRGTWPPVYGQVCPNQLSFQVNIDQTLRTAISSGKSLSIAFTPDVTGINDYRSWFVKNHIPLQYQNDVRGYINANPSYRGLVSDSRAALSGQKFTTIKFNFSPQLDSYEVLHANTLGNYGLKLSGTDIFPKNGFDITVGYKDGTSRTFSNYGGRQERFTGNDTSVTMWTSKSAPSSYLKDIISVKMTTPQGITSTTKQISPPAQPSPTQSTPVTNPPKLTNYQILNSSSMGGNYALTLSGTNLIINSSLAPEAGSTLKIRYKNGTNSTFNDKTFFGNKIYITMYVNKSSSLDNISSIDLTTPRGTTNTGTRK